MTRFFSLLVAAVASLTLISCGSDGSNEPPNVTFGETTIVVVMNPPVNDANATDVPTPGSSRGGVTVTSDDGVTDTTGSDGIAVLADVMPGTRTLSVSDGANMGEVMVEVSDGDLRELAIALDSAGAAVMQSVLYELSGQVTEVTPDMPIEQVNDALSESNRIVFFRGGNYTGNLQFSGSNLTLFGEGPMGGQVTIDGNVTVDGSNNRFRGAVVTGDLSIPGSAAGMSFGRVDGSFELSGSSGVLLQNTYCGSASVTGSDATVLGNAGLAPVPASAGGC